MCPTYNLVRTPFYSPITYCLRRSMLYQSTARSLHTLSSSLIIPPDLITLIRDTMPGDAWLPAVKLLEQKIQVIKRLKGDVKAAEEVDRVVEGLKAKVR